MPTIIERVAAITIGITAMTTIANAPASTPQAKAVLTMQQDLAHRSPDIHWAPGFDPSTADLFAHNELLIRASCEKVFARIVDAKSWPSWYANASNVDILGGATTLGIGTRFRWTTFGLDIESEIHEFEPGRRIGWYGYAPGQPPAFYHTWLLKPVNGGCMTVMEEVGRGKDPAHLRDTGPYGHPPPLFAADVGDTIYFPKKLEHSWRVVGAEPIRLRVLMTPGGFEAFFDLAAERALQVDDGPAMLAAAADVGIVVTGSPLTAEEADIIMNSYATR